MPFSNARIFDWSISIISFLILFFFTELYIWSVIGLCSFVFFSSKFFNDLAKKIEVRDLIIIIALMQWVLGPVLAYTFFPDDPIFYMAVNQEEYMDFVVPATLLFIVGLYLPFFRKPHNDLEIFRKIKKSTDEYPNIDLFLLGIGIIATLLIDYVPLMFRFFVYLLSSIRFIGLYFLLVNNRPGKWIIFFFITGGLLATSIAHAMFHDLILWMGFLFIIIAFIKQINFIQKLIASIAIVLSVFIIQAIKQDVRQTSYRQRSVELFSDMFIETAQNTDYFFSDAYLSSATLRINQGWIIARVLNYVPYSEPFADGETIVEGLKESLIPRFINPDIKSEAGGKEYFERFTGLSLARNTSMNISILGEAYANFGNVYGAIFMLALGLFYSFVYHKIFQIAKHYPSIIFWIPLIFLYVVKAETDFTSTMNYMVKAIMVTWMFFWGLKQFYNIRL